MNNLDTPSTNAHPSLDAASSPAIEMTPQDLELSPSLEQQASLNFPTQDLQSQSSMFEPRIPNDLSWTNISLETKTRKILRNVWGEVKHGETLAVMGPSGHFLYCQSESH
jgi:ABC-type transport system involved in cytochrome bd biosynthesis fused ATPase/permease subunit